MIQVSKTRGSIFVSRRVGRSRVEISRKESLLSVLPFMTSSVKEDFEKEEL